MEDDEEQYPHRFIRYMKISANGLDTWFCEKCKHVVQCLRCGCWKKHKGMYHNNDHSMYKGLCKTCWHMERTIRLWCCGYRYTKKEYLLHMLYTHLNPSVYHYGLDKLFYFDEYISVNKKKR